LSLYEGMFLLDNRQANRDWEGSLASVQSIVTKHGGTIVRSSKWGERRLAYEIKGRRRGTYLLLYFTAEGDAVNRIYREGELSDLILRQLILKISALPSEEKPAEERKQEAAAAPVAVAETESAAGGDVGESGSSDAATEQPGEDEAAPDAATDESAAEAETKEDAAPDV